jgi:hypothetical protein
MPTSNSWSSYAGSFPGYFKVAATLLNDGSSVLITGGTTDPDHSAGSSQAWLFNGGGVTTLPNHMTQPRFGHTATTLVNGKVLIAGSEALDMTSNPYAATAELYDPNTGQFSALSNLVEPRGWHTATLLPSTNEVLIVGGEDPASVNRGIRAPKTSAEIFNFQTMSFRKTKGSLSTGRSRHTATHLQDGTVLIVGGYNPTGSTGFNSAEIYDPVTDTFTPVGNLSLGRWDHAAAFLNDGRVLIAGGYEYGNVGTGQQCEELYNPATKQFTKVPPIQKTVYGLTLSTLLNGKVLAVGGSANNERFIDLTIDDYDWIFDSNQNPPTFTQSSPCLKKIAFQTATVLASGCVFVIGGISVLHSIPKDGMIYWPDLAFLRIRFQGTGKGSVTSQPGGIICTNNVDAQLAVGLHVLLYAQPNAASFSIGYQQVPGTKISGPHWEKVIMHHTNTFDGWGKLPPYDMTNPLVVVMNSNHVVEVNFTDHTSTAPWHLPHR